MRPWLKIFLFGIALLVVLTAAGAYQWWTHPLHPSGAALDLTVEPGTTPRGVAQAVVESGVKTSADLLFVSFRLSGKARQIKAGSYEISNSTTPQSLLSMLIRGEESLKTVTLVEGWNFRQVRQALAKAEQLKPESQSLSEAQLMAQLGVKAGVRTQRQDVLVVVRRHRTRHHGKGLAAQLRQGQPWRCTFDQGQRVLGRQADQQRLTDDLDL